MNLRNWTWSGLTTSTTWKSRLGASLSGTVIWHCFDPAFPHLDRAHYVTPVPSFQFFPAGAGGGEDTNAHVGERLTTTFIVSPRHMSC